MTSKAMLGRNFIRAIKPMLGLDTSKIVSLTIKANCNDVATCEAVVLVKDVNLNIEEYQPEPETTKRCFRFEVTEIIEVD